MAELYEQMLDGEIITVPRDALDIACCSCGLVHRFTVVGGGTVRLRVRLMSRATAQVRRWMRNKREGVFSGAGRGKTAKTG